MPTLLPQRGTAFRLEQGQVLTVIDPQGQQVSDLFCFDAARPEESLSGGRSIDYADSIYLSTGHDLYSNRSRPMLRILEDTCGRHDFLLTPCSREMFRIVDPTDTNHPSCDENLATSFAAFGIGPDRISTTFNLFMNVEVEPSGKLTILPPLSKAGDYVRLRAERDLLVGLTACSHEATNAGSCKPIEFRVG